MSAAASWILHVGIQHHHANGLKRPSAGLGYERTDAVACFVVVFTIFVHGAFLAFGGSLADWVFRVNARISLRNPRRKCTAPGRDAGPSNRGTGNRLCRSGGRRRSRQ